jgi:molybdenum-dependent DNA-binding transcriptional regulator ModE
LPLSGFPGPIGSRYGWEDTSWEMEGLMDRLNAMSVLLAAVEGGSLSQASRTLGIPLATISRKVAELEDHLKATLVIRSAKGLELTPSGRSYITAAKAILEQVTEAERAAAGEYTEPKGDLVVTAPVMFGRRLSGGFGGAGADRSRHAPAGRPSRRGHPYRRSA